MNKHAYSTVVTLMRYPLVSVVVVLILMMAACSMFLLFLQHQRTGDLEEHALQETMKRRFESVFIALNDFPGSAGNDLLFLRSLSSVEGAASNDSWSTVYGDLANLLDRNIAYEALLFADNRRNCVVAVRRPHRDGDEVVCTAPDAIISDILEKASVLDPGEVYISPLTTYASLYDIPRQATIPALIYATPVATEGQKAYDFVISVVNAHYFLKQIRWLSRDGEQVFLIDHRGAYLAHQDQNKEKFAGGTANFFEDFPHITADALIDEKRSAETKHNAFAFWHIHPTVSNFAISKGAHKIKETWGGEAHPWTLVVVSELPENRSWLRDPYMVGIGGMLLASFLIMILFYGTVVYMLREAQIKGKSRRAKKT